GHPRGPEPGRDGGQHDPGGLARQTERRAPEVQGVEEVAGPGPLRELEVTLAVGAVEAVAAEHEAASGADRDPVAGVARDPAVEDREARAGAAEEGAVGPVLGERHARDDQVCGAGVVAL